MIDYMAYIPLEEREVFKQEELPELQEMKLPIVPDANGAILDAGRFASPNYAKGKRGWSIDSDGNAEFGNGIFRGTFNLGATLITVNKFSDIQPAINKVSLAGGGVVSLEPATYVGNATITIPSNVTLDGNGSIIDFNGGAFQILIQGTNAYSVGSMSINFGSSTVTGSGITNWTSSMIGQSMLIGDFWYTITGITNTATATLSSSLVGTSLVGDTYVIATTVDNTGIKNLTAYNSSISLIKGIYVNFCKIDSVNATSGNVGFDFSDSGSVNINAFNVLGCTTAMLFNNVPFCNFLSGTCISSGPASLTRVTNTSITTFSIQAGTGVGLSFVNCSNLGLLSYAIIECVSHGTEFVSGNSDIDVLDGEINSCGGDGIKLTASSNRISIGINSILNNTGWGVNIANANDNNNIVSGNAFSNNTSGNLTDSGTATIAKGNQGVTDIPAPATQVMTLLKSNSGTDSTNAGVTLDSVSISGLTSKDSLLVIYEISQITQPVGQIVIRDSNTLILAYVCTALIAGKYMSGQAHIMISEFSSTNVVSTFDFSAAGGSTAGNSNDATVRGSTSVANVTGWTGSWTLEFRSIAGVTLGGTTRWSWKVYKIAGQ